MVVKIDQRIVHYDGKRDAMLMEVANEGQPKSQENLFTGASAEPLRIPDDSAGVVNVESRFVDSGGDPRVPAVSQPIEPVGGLE